MHAGLVWLFRCWFAAVSLCCRPAAVSPVVFRKPFTVGFVGALDGSDTSRTQLTLADYVDWVRFGMQPKNPG